MKKLKGLLVAIFFFSIMVCGLYDILQIFKPQNIEMKYILLPVEKVEDYIFQNDYPDVGIHKDDHGLAVYVAINNHTFWNPLPDVASFKVFVSEGYKVVEAICDTHDEVFFIEENKIIIIDSNPHGNYLIKILIHGSGDHITFIPYIIGYVK